MTTSDSRQLLNDATRLWARVFRVASVGEFPFADRAWEVFLLPHELIMPKGEFGYLRASADLLGDRELIAVGDDLQSSVVIDWDYKSLTELAGHRVAVNDVYLFGRSAAWGMICTKDDFSMLSGVPAFMDRYAQEAGGRQRLREEFLRWIRPPGWFVPDQTTQKLLALARWHE